jgi:4-hydroxy-3-methylbut-2-enyl diphosphate reductase
VTADRRGGRTVRADGPTFLAPLRIEALAARHGAGGNPVLRIGMGPARASAARARLDRTLPTGAPVVLLGLAGGLVPGTAPGEVVVATSVELADGGQAVAIPFGADVGEILAAAGLRVRCAPVASSARIVTGTAARSAVASHGAVAVDMESYWCTPLARAHPFAVVRVVLDVPGRDLVSPATAFAASRAYRSLVRSARALRRWSPVSVDGSNLLEVGDR